MSRSRDLANLGDEATGGITVSDISDISSTYLTQSSASSTYATNSGLSSTYQTITNSDKLAHQSVPHIIPGILYPAISGKLLDGTTDHGTGTYDGSAVSTDYGTTQSDGRKYYYTDIKGSSIKGIKDPRIGGHFGSQRHKFKSLQLLEQESATHGNNVYSIDGREWLRLSDKTNAWSTINDEYGHHLFWNSTTDSNEDFFEIVGYFNGANLINLGGTTQKSFAIKIDGSVNNSLTDYNSHRTTNDSPLVVLRFVDAGGVTNIPISTTLGIHTLRLELHGSVQYLRTFGIELIAHDTANVNEIKIPKQNVVSYGKKFEVGSDDLDNAVHPHYDPFNGFINDTTLFSSVVDTATSLGLGTATTYGAPWDKGGNNHIRPFNGGRVVRWVDSSGTIKTSVTMMPANAQNIGNNNLNGSAGTASNEITTASATNSHTINFSDDVLDTSLSEIAKTFHHREMGNGSANGNAIYRDATVNLSDSDMSFVLDDGLTSLSGKEVTSTSTAFYPGGTDKYWYLTFIGTGISVTGINGTANLAMNLPYGTHILKYTRASTTTSSPWVLDGVEIRQSWGSSSNESHAREFNIHQPKRPPIPEEAVILADYMLMADFVPQTASAWGNISKGVITKHNSRDFFYDAPSGTATGSGIDLGLLGLSSVYQYLGNVAGTITQKIPYFGTSFTQRFNSRATYSITTGTTYTVNGSDLSSYTVSAGGSGQSAFTSAGVLTKVAGNHENFASAKGGTLGTSILSITEAGASGKYAYPGPVDVATPIHTSHHYQSFETPFLHELVGGDRNMEQTNLVCTPDGRTWDQISRDTSYIGPRTKMLVAESGSDAADFSDFTDHRGGFGPQNLSTKNIAWGYNRIIILEDGYYDILLTYIASGGNTYPRLHINSTSDASKRVYDHQAQNNGGKIIGKFNLKRNDYIYVTIDTNQGYMYGQNTESGARIYVTKIE